MYLNESMQEHCERCRKQIAFLEEKVKLLPEGNLQTHRTKNYYMWRVTDAEGNRRIIPKAEGETAQKLALRKLYMAQIHDLKAEAEAAERYVRYKNRSYSEVERLLKKETPEFRRLIEQELRPKDERIFKWENEPYRKSNLFPEELKYPTLKEKEFVRSKLEATFAASLTALKLPYQYEKILWVNGIEIAADFSVLDIRVFQEIPIELFGMMDNPDYRKTYKKKMKTYIDGGYIPGVNMLAFYETLQAPLGQAEMMEELVRFFVQKPPIRF